MITFCKLERHVIVYFFTIVFSIKTLFLLRLVFANHTIFFGSFIVADK